MRPTGRSMLPSPRKGCSQCCQIRRACLMLTRVPPSLSDCLNSAHCCNAVHLHYTHACAATTAQHQHPRRTQLLGHCSPAVSNPLTHRPAQPMAPQAMQTLCRSNPSTTTRSPGPSFTTQHNINNRARATHAMPPDTKEAYINTPIYLPSHTQKPGGLGTPGHH